MAKTNLLGSVNVEDVAILYQLAKVAADATSGKSADDTEMIVRCLALTMVTQIGKGRRMPRMDDQTLVAAATAAIKAAEEVLDKN